MRHLLAKAAKAVIKELYWAYCYEEDEHSSRMAVFYFDPNTPKDIVIGKLQDWSRQSGKKVTNAHVYKLHEEDK